LTYDVKGAWGKKKVGTTVNWWNCPRLPAAA